jgi:hypothetical protein
VAALIGNIIPGAVPTPSEGAEKCDWIKTAIYGDAACIHSGRDGRIIWERFLGTGDTRVQSGTAFTNSRVSSWISFWKPGDTNEGEF